jgi:hypothetical protein
MSPLGEPKEGFDVAIGQDAPALDVFNIVVTQPYLLLVSLTSNYGSAASLCDAVAYLGVPR